MGTGNFVPGTDTAPAALDRSPSAGPWNVVLVIGRLAMGGAELQTIALARGLAARGHRVRIVTLFAGGELAGSLVDSAVRHHSLSTTAPGRPGRTAWALARAPGRLRAALRSEPADVVVSALYSANVVSALAVGRSGPPLVFSVRAARAQLGQVRRAMFRLAARLSRRTAAVVGNTRAGLDDHIARGFSATHRAVIPNGIDTEQFRPVPAAGRAARDAWNLPEGVPVVGRVGRLTPVKDHETFLRAMAELRTSMSSLHVLCVGGGPPDFRASLERRAASLGLDEVVRFTGACDREDLPGLYGAMDVAVSSSRSEGFPNVVAEAMACGVPVVATDVGGTAQVVGDAGTLVPPADPTALSAAVRSALTKPRDDTAGRDRIVARFSVDRMVVRTEQLLTNLIRGA